jgi:hypothetical protein
MKHATFNFFPAEVEAREKLVRVSGDILFERIGKSKQFQSGNCGDVTARN